MRTYIIVKGRKALPKTFELAAVMWKEGISLSRCGDAYEFKNCTTLALSWDKWIDDEKWSGKNKSSQLIYFELPKKIEDYSDKITIEMDDNAVLVDKRAFYKAAIYIAEMSEGKISIDGIKWLTPEKYKQQFKDYLDYSFEEAVELSFNETVR